MLVNPDIKYSYFDSKSVEKLKNDPVLKSEVSALMHNKPLKDENGVVLEISEEAKAMEEKLAAASTAPASWLSAARASRRSSAWLTSATRARGHLASASGPPSIPHPDFSSWATCRRMRSRWASECTANPAATVSSCPAAVNLPR